MINLNELYKLNKYIIIYNILNKIKYLKYMGCHQYKALFLFYDNDTMQVSYNNNIIIIISLLYYWMKTS